LSSVGTALSVSFGHHHVTLLKLEFSFNRRLLGIGYQHPNKDGVTNNLLAAHGAKGDRFIFRKLTEQIGTLDKKRQYLDADWEESGNHSLLDFYVKIMPQLINAERCSIFVHDPSQQAVWLKAGTGVEEKEIEVLLEEDSIVGGVIETGKPVIIHGVNETEGKHKATDRETGFVTESILCIPIRSLDGKKITGAIQLLNKKADELFDDEDLNQLEELAHYLEWSLENIYYHAEAKEVLQSIYNVLTKITLAVVVLLVLISPILMLWGFPILAKFFSGGG